MTNACESIKSICPFPRAGALSCKDLCNLPWNEAIELNDADD